MSAPRRHLGAGAAMSVLAQIGPLLAAGVLSVVLARKIGPSGNGRYVLLATLVGISSMAISLGLHSGITYEVSRRRWSVGRAFRTSYRVGLLLGLVGVLGGLGFFALTRHTVYAGIDVGVALLALSSLPPVLAYEYGAAILLARERYEGYAVVLIAHAAALMVVGVVLVFPFGLTGAVVGLPVSAVIGAILGARLLAREARRDVALDSGDSLPRAMRFGLQSWGANLLQQVNYRFDVVILGGFASAADVGVYSIALTITGIAWVLPQALQTVLFPRAASLDESAVTGEVSAAESDDAVAKAVRHGVLLALPTALFVALLLLVAVPLLYGGKFHDTTPLGFVLLPGVLLIGVGKILGSAIAGRGYPRYALYGGAVSVPLTLGLYFGLIPQFDAWGAAVGSSISYAFSALLGAFFFKRVTRIGLREAFVPTREDLSDYRTAAELARTRFGRIR
jgi:O-antigen/teichoic acid export membrane protein